MNIVHGDSQNLFNLKAMSSYFSNRPVGGGFGKSDKDQVVTELPYPFPADMKPDYDPWPHEKWVIFGIIILIVAGLIWKFR